MAGLFAEVDDQTLAPRYRATRALTEVLAEPLSAEDQTVQSMPDVSPTKWHRAHTSWFFETFLLAPGEEGFTPFHPGYAYLFNSYYERIGARSPRHERGMVSRPGIVDIAAYRAHVDEGMERLLDRLPSEHVLDLAVLGIEHEKQHQELLLMDIKHVLSKNPLHPVYRQVEPPMPSRPRPVTWLPHDGGAVNIGHDGGGFSFDNERPRHLVQLLPFSIADRPVTCGEWISFTEDGGYRRADLWLSDGWATVQAERWDAPLYWERVGSNWHLFTLGGTRPVDPAEPVCHISYYEADAFARWAGGRLPTESEWEALEPTGPAEGAFLDVSTLHPRPTPAGAGLRGDVWQWTSSAYSAYPGFEVAPGAVGEYNGKFMVNQYVLRGGSCATPPGHVRSTYRNFFPPAARWAFSGLRLARNI